MVNFCYKKNCYKYFWKTQLLPGFQAALNISDSTFRSKYQIKQTVAGNFPQKCSSFKMIIFPRSGGSDQAQAPPPFTLSNYVTITAAVK